MRGYPEQHFRRDIQGMRGVAISVAVAYHAGVNIPGGFVTFDMFFVISGFVIAGILTREQLQTGRVNLRRFYRARMRRLFAALAVMVSSTVVLSALLLAPTAPQSAALRTAIGALSLHANYTIPAVSGNYFGLQAEQNPLLHTWSLSLEEQIYLVFPLLLILGWRVGSPRKGASLNVLVVGVLLTSLVLAATTEDVSTGPLLAPLWGYYGPAGRLWEFLFGALLAINWPRFGLSAGRLSSVIAGVSLVSLISSFFVVNDTMLYPGLTTLWPVLSIGALICTSMAGPIGSLLSHPVLARTGDMSYSIYLWHWPLISLAATTLGIGWVLIAAGALSLSPAAVSYRYFESPFRSSTPRSSPPVRIGRAFMIPAIATVLAVTLAWRNAYWSENVRGMVRADEAHTPERLNCAARSGDDLCVFNTVYAGRPPVYLVGDSSAEQYAEGLTAAANAVRRPVILITESACPPFDVLVDNQGDPRIETGVERCADFYTEMMRRLTGSEEPATVVLAFGSSYLGDQDISVLGTDGGSTGADAFVAGIRETVGQLLEYGHELVIAQPIPQTPRDWGPRECALVAILSGRCSFGLERADVVRSQARLRSAIRYLEGVGAVRVLDPIDRLCTATRCPSERNGTILYRDFRHISVQASKSFRLDWQEILLSSILAPTESPRLATDHLASQKRPLPPSFEGRRLARPAPIHALRRS